MTEPMARSRLLTDDVRTEEASSLPADPQDVIEGTPATMTIPLAALGDAEFGIWEITAGTVRDTETDEIFLVIDGSGTVEFGDGTTIELNPGVAVRLFADDRTIWRIAKTLRKVYFAG